jgi:hypothetical protein
MPRRHISAVSEGLADSLAVSGAQRDLRRGMGARRNNSKFVALKVRVRQERGRSAM